MKPGLAALLPALGQFGACDAPATSARATPPAAASPAAQPARQPRPAAPGAAEPAVGATAELAGTTDEYETLYVVIADPSRPYRPLRRLAATGQRSDTRGRFYDPQKDLVRLPDDAGELYAGDYFPRRPTPPCA